MQTPTRSFTGVSRLYGELAAQQLAQAHVIVVGVGGVGSWAAEALARSGVGQLTLIDLDVVAQSNINRQIHALNESLGANKVDVMKQRIAQINEACLVNAVDDFLTLDNMATLISAKPNCETPNTEGATFVIDAIDSPRVKAALISFCALNKLPIAVAGAAGGRDDPLALHEQDIALCKGDALLANVRSRLRRDFGFTRELGKKMGVTTVVSRQSPLASAAVPEIGNTGSPLNCAGYGSIVTVTATMGMALAAIAIRKCSA